ncbi:MAG: DUF3300 domain-containing protein [Deltaproteobacteria bacterium]|nr:DUF3300 domain-containing protein [Deltaproteobacteria bacterium]MCW8892569.1 DUF3300 domain-containing protein [Deltaproteobacteria bacterium]
MKFATVLHLTLGLLFILFLTFVCILSPGIVNAQVNDNLEAFEKYNEEELAQMLAPIALYPDALLSQLLMASTYPIEIIEADRWVRDNPELTGDTLDNELLDMDWDPSVKAICHFPSILALMSERISETTNLGNAFLAQEAEVMGMIQKLRAGAYEQGTLRSTSEQMVVVENQTIIIEPVNPRVIYIPYYDPYYVYGTWWWTPGFAPYYWGPPGVDVGVGISFWPGIYFGVSFYRWSYFDWRHHFVHIDLHKRPKFVRHDYWRGTSERWVHVPKHRRGVAYRDKSTARKFGQSSHRPAVFRRDARGFPEQSLIKQSRPEKDRTNINLYRQQQQRIERKRTELEQATNDRKERLRIAPEKHKLQRKESPRPKPARAENNRQERVRVAPELQRQRRVEQKNQRERPDNIFNRLEDGKQERKASERGRYSRKIDKDENRDERNDSFRSWRKSEN